jgi:anti-sigma factor RsiW
MNCEETRDLLMDFIGDEISKADAQQLKKHLTTCTDCREELARISATKACLLKGWPDEAVPQPLVFSFNQPASQQRWSWPGFWAWPPAVRISLSIAMCFMLCIVMLAVARTRIQFDHGNFAISFGSMGASSAALPPASLNLTGAASNQEQLRGLVSQVVSEQAQRQNDQWQHLIVQVRTEWESQRQTDLQGISGKLKYLESTQNLIWKETAKNNSYVESLARDVYLRTGLAQAAQP